MHPDQIKWDRIYRSKAELTFPIAEVLKQNKHLLPLHGRALDLACGLGGNSLFLAQHGLSVSAWDISPIAIGHLNDETKRRGLALSAETRNVVQNPLPEACFDVIVVSHFLVREMVCSLVNALKPNGLLFYQTFTQKKVFDEGPNNPDYLLAENELLQMFRDLQIHVYREESDLGLTSEGWRNQAMLIGRKVSRK